MKRLSLLRHAKSSWGDPGLDDFDRPLNPRGRDAAVRMGEDLFERALGYDLALVSPARRAAETFALIQEACPAALDVRPEPRLYGASVGDLLGILAETPAEIERLLLVGHNPGLHELAMRLLSDNGSPARAALAAKLPSGSLVEIGLPVESWTEAGNVKGELVRFTRPRDLAMNR